MLYPCWVHRVVCGCPLLSQSSSQRRLRCSAPLEERIGPELCPLHFYLEDESNGLNINLQAGSVIVLINSTVCLSGPHFSGPSIIAWHAATSISPVILKYPIHPLHIYNPASIAALYKTKGQQPRNTYCSCQPGY